MSPHGSAGEDGSETRPLSRIQKAVDLAQSGDTIKLEAGDYFQDVVSRRSGLPKAPILIEGPKEAVIRGGGNDRVVEINHSYITLSGFTIDGLFGKATSKEGYRDKLIFILGKEPRRGPMGVRILDMNLRNAGGECVRLRYFARENEISSNTIQNCGRYDFVFGERGKNGEGVYIGTAPEQLWDGKSPTADRDESNDNWVHHNIFDTQGNECVDIKEGAEGNLVELNSCRGQKDPESGGFESRGNFNVWRSNTIFDNEGAGIRLGGDAKSDGINNEVYFNDISGNRGGGIKVQRSPQGTMCGNTLSGNRLGEIVGDFGEGFQPTEECPDELISQEKEMTPLDLENPDGVEKLGSTAQISIISALWKKFGVFFSRLLSNWREWHFW